MTGLQAKHYQLHIVVTIIKINTTIQIYQQQLSNLYIVEPLMEHDMKLNW